jgi:protein O-GlcNAc transferase
MNKPGRNDPCPCGSGRKYKLCCLAKPRAHLRGQTPKGSDPGASARDIRETLTAAIALHRAGNLAAAESLYLRILRQSPREADALHLLGLIAHQTGRHRDALDLIGRAIGVRDTEYGYHNNLGLVYKALGRLDEAAAAYRRALALNPDFAEAACNLGVILADQGRYEEAEARYRRALALSPGFAEAACNLGIALAEQGKPDEAADCYRRALETRPDFAEAHYNLGLARHRLGDAAGAEESCAAAVQHRPAYPEAWYLLGVLAQKRDDAERALACFNEVLMLEPDHVGAQFNKGLELVRLNRLDEGEAALERTLSLNPGHAEARYSLGYNRLLQGRREEAIEDCEKALALAPDHAAALDTWLFALLYKSGTTAEQIGAAHGRYAARIEAPLQARRPVHCNPPDPARRLRIGYVSPDLHLHSVAFFLEPILDHHDRTRFEICCYSNSAVRDEYTVRFIAAADLWIPCHDLSDDALAERIVADGIDILVDLAGHSAHNRLRVFARKPAPVQVTWLGYPETTGLKAIDYRITTADVDPPGSERWHSEALWRLPRSLWCYRPPVDMAGLVSASPCAGAGFVTFGSMNNLSKLTPETLGLWARILNAVPGARLRMTNIPEGSATERLREFFIAHGIPAERLHIHGKMSHAGFRAALGEIDIALDSFPYNGTTTTCQSLWMGIPVIALAGSTSVSRSGLALLRLVGLEELCARDEDEYVGIATALARDPARLGGLRSELRARFEASPLRDEPGITREIEAAYRAIWQAWCSTAAGSRR